MEFSLDPHTWLFNLFVRVSGPATLRFVLQPLLAVALGIRDGRNDARMAQTPYLSRIFSDAANRRSTLVSGCGAIKTPFLVALLVDAAVSLFVLGAIYPVSTLFVASLLVALPYVISREVTNRIVLSGWFDPYSRRRRAASG
jgi:hypothetical protein